MHKCQYSDFVDLDSSMYPSTISDPDPPWAKEDWVKSLKPLEEVNLFTDIFIKGI